MIKNKLLNILSAFIFTLSVGVYAQASGESTISSIDQWKATSTLNAITQRVENKPLLITGLTAGECVKIASNRLATTTPCGGAGTVTTDSTLTGDGSGGTPLGINLNNANTWLASQTFLDDTIFSEPDPVSSNTLKLIYYSKDHSSYQESWSFGYNNLLPVPDLSQIVIGNNNTMSSFAGFIAGYGNTATVTEDIFLLGINNASSYTSAGIGIGFSNTLGSGSLQFAIGHTNILGNFNNQVAIGIGNDNNADNTVTVGIGLSNYATSSLDIGVSDSTKLTLGTSYAYFRTGVGIGSSTPSTKLVVSGTTTVQTLVSTSTATSTFGGGINLSTGCFAIGGTCIGGGSGSGTVSSGIAGQLGYYQSNGTTINGTSSIFVSPTGLIGIGTTTPVSELHVLSTVEQLRLGYDASNYVTQTISSGGLLSWQTTAGATAGIYTLTPHGAGGVGTNRTINFGSAYGNAALWLYNAGAGTRYGWGMQNDAMQFFQATGTGKIFTWNRGGDLQSSGTNELMRLYQYAAGTAGLSIGGGGGAFSPTSPYKIELDGESLAGAVAGTQDIIRFRRGQTGGVSYPEAFTIGLGRYSSTGTGPDTRVDFNLKSTAATDFTAGTGVMSLNSNSRVLVGAVGAASETLHVVSTATSTVYASSTSATRGGRIVLEDVDAAGCTEVTALNGVLTAAIVTCP